MPSTSQVSFASQNGPMEATISHARRGSASANEQADAEVVAVEDDIGEDRQAHQGGEGERQPFGRGSSESIVGSSLGRGMAAQPVAGASGAVGVLARQVEDARRHRRRAAARRASR